jgi:RnfABCDGE-type electron transport complex B subunit
MLSVAISIAVMGGVALLFAVVISVAHKKLKVEVDPRVESLVEILPGVNCGACGYPGCQQYAEAVVKGEEPNKCSVGGPEVAAEVAKIMGVEVGEVVKKVAKVLCIGDREKSVWVGDYDGPQTCAAAHISGGAGKLCSYGCLGFADCVRACPFDAIHMNDKGIPVVDEEKCTGCGLCAEACPRNIIVIEPIDRRTYVFCRSQDTPKTSRQVCSVACIACGICVRFSPEGMKMDGNLAVVVDQDKVNEQSIQKCPTKVLFRM